MVCNAFRLGLWARIVREPVLLRPPAGQIIGYFESYGHELDTPKLTDLPSENARPSSSVAPEDRLQSLALPLHRPVRRRRDPSELWLHRSRCISDAYLDSAPLLLGECDPRKCPEEIDQEKRGVLPLGRSL